VPANARLCSRAFSDGRSRPRSAAAITRISAASARRVIARAIALKRACRGRRTHHALDVSIQAQIVNCCRTCSGSQADVSLHRARLEHGPLSVPRVAVIAAADLEMAIADGVSIAAASLYAVAVSQSHSRSDASGNARIPTTPRRWSAREGRLVEPRQPLLLQSGAEPRCTPYQRKRTMTTTSARPHRRLQQTLRSRNRRAHRLQAGEQLLSFRLNPIIYSHPVVALLRQGDPHARACAARRQHGVAWVATSGCTAPGRPSRRWDRTGSMRCARSCGARRAVACWLEGDYVSVQRFEQLKSLLPKHARGHVDIISMRYVKDAEEIRCAASLRA